MRSNYFKLFSHRNIFILLLITSLFIILITFYFSINLVAPQSKVNKINTPHKLGIRLITFDNLLSNIITVGYDGNIIKWDLNNLSILNSVKLNRNDASCITINSYNRIISIGFKDGDFAFINLDDLSLITTFKITNSYNAISVNVSIDKDYFIVIYSDNSLKIYSFETGNLLKSIDNYSFTGYIPKINMKKRIIAFYSTNKVVLYSLHSYSIIKEIKLSENEIIYDIKYTDNGKELLIAGEKGIIYSVDINLTFNLSEIHKTNNNEWIVRISTDKLNNIVYITDKNNIYFLNRHNKKSYRIAHSENDVLNLEIEKYGRYFAYTDMLNLYLIQINDSIRKNF